MKNNSFIHKIHIVLILSLLISSLLSAYFVKRFDKYEVTTDLREAHSMIKSDIQSYWVDAEIFKNDLNSKKGFFSSGGEMWRSFLHSKIIGFYYYITNLMSGRLRITIHFHLMKIKLKSLMIINFYFYSYSH